MGGSIIYFDMEYYPPAPSSRTAQPVRPWSCSSCKPGQTSSTLKVTPQVCMDRSETGGQPLVVHKILFSSRALWTTFGLLTEL